MDTGHLQLLRNPDWQVIYGRRGTGKTFLLGVLQEEAARSLTESRIMSVFVTAQDCLVSPVGRDVPDTLRALGYFQTFIELLTGRVLESVDRLVADASFLSTVVGRRHHLLDRILQLQYDLLEAAQEGAPVLAYSSYEVKRSGERASRKSGTLALGIGAKAGGVEQSLSATAAAGAERSSSSSAQVVAQYEAGAVPRFALVRRKLIELLQVLEVRHLNILIDEWSTLDPTGSLLARSTHLAFLVDYGLWLDWKRDSLRRAGTRNSPIFPTADEQFDLHVVRFKGLGGRTTCCVHCAAVFPRDARPYTLRGLCPECFRPADGE